MKKIFRIIFGLIVVSPFVVASKLLSIFLGQKRAIEVVGPTATRLAKQSLKHWIPKIDDSTDFDSFPAKMKKIFRLWRLFYDIEISEESNDVFKLNVSNCPFWEMGSPIKGYVKRKNTSPMQKNTFFSLAP